MRKTLRVLQPFIPALFLLFFLDTAHAQQTDGFAKANTLIQQNAASIGLSADDLKNYRISDMYTDKLSGATLVYLQQTYKGIDVMNAVQTLAFKNDKLMSVAGKRIDKLDLRVNIKEAKAALTASDAVRAAAKHLNLTAPAFMVALKQSADNNETEFGDLGISTDNIKSKLLWVFNPSSKNFVLSWQVNIQPKAASDYWLVNIDASTGLFVNKINLTVNCDWSNPRKPGFINAEGKNEYAGIAGGAEIKNSYFEKFSAEAIDSAKYRVIPFPVQSPAYSGGTPTLVSNPWELAGAGNNATTLKWNADSTTTYDSTRGNNVLAVEDVNGDNKKGQGANSSTAIPKLTFDFVPNFTKQPTDSANQNFAITNLFYWNNIMHDISYQYGFDEVSGNFQKSNLGRGGKGNDYVFADAQDGSGTNNANFATPNDGTSPRMQMYLFDGFPQLDGDLDNGVISHEFTHGISNRLTGGPSNSACLQNAEQMGEGWSDYMALMVTTNWSNATVNDGPKKKPIGNYVIGEDSTGLGIRTYPYSTDMSIDPWTYADMLATGGEVHKTGEIWCSVLWDLTWNLILQNGINTNIYSTNNTAGNTIALKLVMEGMKLQKCSPGFIDGRDAILKADTLLYAGAHGCLIWQTFARRGMGYYASEGSSDNVGDEVADFSSASFTKTVSKDSALQGESITYNFSVKTGKCFGISNYKIVDTLPVNLTYVSGGSYNSSNRTVTFSNISIAANSIANYSFIAKVNTGTYSDSVEHINETVTSTSLPSEFKNVSIFSGSPWRVKGVHFHSSPYALFAADTTAKRANALQTKNKYFLDRTSILSFWHYYNTETGYDGGVVEISTNNGLTWKDLGSDMFQNGYNNVSSPYEGSSGSYIAGRSCFGGSSNGQFIQTKINLSAFAGDSVLIRFLFATDVGNQTTYDGWYLDDILLTSESGIFNLGQMFDNSNVQEYTSNAYTVIKNGSLPILWGDFSVTKQGNSALLKWQTLQESNSASFTIERSTDGITFKEVGSVTAAGNSTTIRNYQFTDNLPLSGTDYYRIKQFDKDGSFSFSPTRSLEFLLNRVITITPNPAKDKVAITVTGNTQPLKIYLVNALGQQLSSFDMSGQYLQINLPHIAPGTYYIKVSGATINTTQKLVVE